MSHPPVRHSIGPTSFLRIAVLTLVACGGSDGPVADADGCIADDPAATAFCRGKAAFEDRTLTGLGGNGRACADCHMPSENFQLTPATAQSRLATMRASGVDDPLLRALDANDIRSRRAPAPHLYRNSVV